MSCLLLQNITADDSGKYDICVENAHGADCSYASVSVEGKIFFNSILISLLSRPAARAASKVARSRTPRAGVGVCNKLMLSPPFFFFEK